LTAFSLSVTLPPPGKKSTPAGVNTEKSPGLASSSQRRMTVGEAPKTRIGVVPTWWV